MKIYIFDSWGKFWKPTIEYWQALGHEVKTGIYWGAELVEWADVAIFHPVQDNLRKASRGPKPPNTRIVAEAVDIDIYAGHYREVNYDYVDALVFMAHHTRALAEKHFKFPKDLPIHIVPGGLDVDKWPMRRDASRGYNVCWIGRFWIPKNVFGALQVFNQLIQTDPGNPWRLFLRGEKYHPEWWQMHVEAYLEANPKLRERVEFVPWVDDLNEWLEPMGYIAQVSMKEAFGFCVAECASKGIKPVIQMTNGALDTWPSSWVFQTHDEAVRMFLSDNYEPETYRAYIADQYPLSRRMEMLDEICGIS